jgi:hypothetical protein
MAKGSYYLRTAVTASYTAMPAYAKMTCPSTGLSAAVGKASFPTASQAETEESVAERFALDACAVCETGDTATPAARAATIPATRSRDADRRGPLERDLLVRRFQSMICPSPGRCSRSTPDVPAPATGRIGICPELDALGLPDRLFVSGDGVGTCHACRH